MNAKVCRCDYAYLGAQMVGTPTRCEKCDGLIDDVARARMDAADAESLRKLHEWAAANPITRQHGTPR